MTFHDKISHPLHGTLRSIHLELLLAPTFYAMQFHPKRGHRISLTIPEKPVSKGFERWRALPPGPQLRLSTLDSLQR